MIRILIALALCAGLAGAENLLPVPSTPASSHWKGGEGVGTSGNIWKQGWSGNAWDASTEGRIGFEQTDEGLALFVRNLAGRDAMQLYPAKPVALEAGATYELSFRYRCQGGLTGVFHYSLKGDGKLAVVEQTNAGTDTRMQLTAADWTPVSARFRVPEDVASPELKLNLQARGAGPDTGFQIVDLELVRQ